MSYYDTKNLRALTEAKTQPWIVGAQERLWHYRKNSSQHSPISAVLTVGKTTDCEGEGGRGRLHNEGPPGIAEMHSDRERIHTNGRNYLWYCKGEREISSNMLVCVTRL